MNTSKSFFFHGLLFCSSQDDQNFHLGSLWLDRLAAPYSDSRLSFKQLGRLWGISCLNQTPLSKHLYPPFTISGCKHSSYDPYSPLTYSSCFSFILQSLYSWQHNVMSSSMHSLPLPTSTCRYSASWKAGLTVRHREPKGKVHQMSLFHIPSAWWIQVS